MKYKIGDEVICTYSWIGYERGWIGAVVKYNSSFRELIVDFPNGNVNFVVCIEHIRLATKLDKVLK